MHKNSAFALAASLLTLTACTKKDEGGTQDWIVVGEVGSMTGSEATFGTSTHRGIDLAIGEVNARGGVKGRKIKVVALDDQGKPDEAATAVTRLITQDKVVAILGEVASSRSLAMAPIAQAQKIPMITPSSTNPKVTEIGDYIFRVCFIDPFQGTVMAKFATDKLKAKRVAILTDVKNDYSVGLAKYFKETFEAKGGKIVATQSYSAGDIDFKSQLTSIRSTNPDAVFVPGYYTEVGLVARQARQMGLKVPLMGGDGWDSPKLTEIGGDSINGNYFSNHYSQEDTSPRVQEFIQKYKAAYSETPDSMAALGYDAALILVEAMERSRELTPAAIRGEIAKTSGFKGVTGSITLNSQRNAVKSAVVLKVEAGQLKFQTTVDPT